MAAVLKRAAPLQHPRHHWHGMLQKSTATAASQSMCHAASTRATRPVHHPQGFHGAHLLIACGSLARAPIQSLTLRCRARRCSAPGCARHGFVKRCAEGSCWWRELGWVEKMANAKWIMEFRPGCQRPESRVHTSLAIARVSTCPEPPRAERWHAVPSCAAITAARREASKAPAAKSQKSRIYLWELCTPPLRAVRQHPMCTSCREAAAAASPLHGGITP